MTSSGDSDDDFELPTMRYKPDSLESLVNATRFSRQEIQMMYRGFKQGCPNGIVTQRKFKEIYAQFFPQGDSANYAHYVFNTFDLNGDGHISFEEFAIGISILSKGEVRDKLEWIFHLYDQRHQGHISRHDVQAVVQSVYDLMGAHVNPPLETRSVVDRVNYIFQKLDTNNCGLVTKDEFLSRCSKLPALLTDTEIIAKMSKDPLAPLCTLLKTLQNLLLYKSS